MIIASPDGDIEQMTVSIRAFYSYYRRESGMGKRRFIKAIGALLLGLSLVTTAAACGGETPPKSAAEKAKDDSQKRSQTG